ncbi:MAG: GntR family transcriptional regulator [Spirochaetaceae bacterium]|jgi:DNA-binding FadR family transcriptional regulator|nr:GntR family transcriptional regulator [Spirochaetaceae bacterium]
MDQVMVDHFINSSGQQEGDERIYQKTVVVQAMEKIRILLTSGKYRPGDKIPTEHELIERFGIGRSSIREALKIFQHLGILKSQASKGTILCDKSRLSSEAITWSIFLSSQDLKEIVHLRQVLEEAAFHYALNSCLQDAEKFQTLINRLEAEVGNMRTAVKESSIEKLTQADYAFHAIFFQEGENRLFQDIYRTLYAFTMEEIKKSYEAIEDLDEVPLDHQEMIDAVKTEDIETAIARHHAHFPRIMGLLKINP